MSFALIEVNERLCKFASDKIWNSKEAKKMNFYQKIEYANPTSLMEEQALLNCLEEVNKQLGIGLED